MKSIIATLWAESLKVRKSKVFWLSIIFFVFVSFMMGLIMLIQKHPEITEKIGIIGTKASMLKTGEPNWQNFFTLLLQGISAIGLIGFGFITSWVFGREYTENTLKDIIALPVSRSSIVVSKLLIVIIWSIILAYVFAGSSILFGYMAGLSDMTHQILSLFFINYTQITLMTILLITPVAFFASYSKGFLLPIGIIILTMIMANFSGLIGLGPYFPWSIPGLLSVSVSSDVGQLTIVSYIILFITSSAGLLGTLTWWRYADQK